jgi:hypothetical protein
MDKIGLVSKLALTFDNIWDSSREISQSDLTKKHNVLLADTVALLKNVHAAKDIKLALGIEDIFLREELEKYSNSAEEMGSLQKALAQLQEARQSYSVVQNPAVYKEATKTYSGKPKEAGLPIDSFRQFLKSHSTRLHNLMTGQISVPEKKVHPVVGYF